MTSIFPIPPKLLVPSAIAALLAVSAPSSAQSPPAPIEKTDAPIDVRVEGEGGGSPRAARDPDVASYVIRGEDLRRPGATAIDVIAASPGVEPSRSGAGSDLATISIRGAPSAQIPVYLAGVRLNDDVTGSADLSTIPLHFLDRIEVYRGGAPASATRLGIGGALFFEPRLPRGTHVGVRLGAGSFGELTMGAFATLGDDRSGALFSIARQSATNDFSYTDDGGTFDPADDRKVTRKNGDATTIDAWAIGRTALPGGGRVVILANAFAREQGVVGTIRSVATAARSDTQREIGAASVRMPCAKQDDGAALTERCSIDVSFGAVLSRRVISDPKLELATASSRAIVTAERWEQSARIQGRLGDSFRAGATISTGVDRLDVSLAGDLRTTSARLAITGAADVALRPTKSLELFALGAGECHSPIGTAGACGIGGPSGRVGLRITPLPTLDLTMSGGSYFRAPTLGELYGLSGTVIGNGALVPERGYSVETGARWSAASLSGDVSGYVDLTGFARFVEDMIVYNLTRPDTVKPFNIGKARVLGVEATSGVAAFHHLRAQVSATLLDPRDVESSGLAGLLPYHAPLMIVTSIQGHWDLTGLLPYAGVGAITARFAYRAARVADSQGLVALGEQQDLGVDAALSFARDRLVARASMTNLLDVGSQDVLGFPLPGRAFHAVLEGKF